MRKPMLALVSLLVMSSGVARAQIPWRDLWDLQPPMNSCCNEMDPKHTFWFSSEYLVWWITDQRLRVPLVTGGTSGQVLFGQNDLDYQAFSGGRVTLGSWINCQHTIGMEINGFYLEQRTFGDRFTSGGEGGATLFVPFTKAVYNTSSSFTIADAAANRTGGIAITTSSRMWGAEASTVFNRSRACGFELDYYFGFRYLDLDEDLNILASTVTTDTGTGNQTFAAIQDHFDTRNQFYGGQVGFKLGWYPCRWSCELIGKVALGNVHQVVEITGQTRQTGQTTSTTPGGFFTQPSNISRRTHDEFAVVPQAQLKIGFELFPERVFLGLGYDFLYWNRVVRPGSQIDAVVDPNQAATTPVGGARPLPFLNPTDFIAHGASLSLEFRY